MDAGSFVTLSATKSQSQFLQHRNSRKITWERTLDVPDLAYDFYLNLLDWGSSNVLAIALGLTVYQWDATDCITSELVTVDEESGPVTSVKWAPDGRHISVGLNNGDVQLWDSTANRLLRTLRGGHQSRVGALDWNSHVLTTGGMDGLIVNNDVRISSPIVEIYSGHHREVCGLKWSASGQQLASGGNDHLLHIWDRSMASINAPTQYLYRLEYHTAAVKALAWCPFQANLLASGGGGGDNCINFWNTHTGAGLISVDTGSQVSALLWSKNERELLSSHGFTRKQMTLWKYPSMAKMAEITGHTSGVLFMAQSPDGCTVAVAAGDETLRYWNIFGSPEEGAFDADKVYMAAIDKFGDMMFKSNAHTPDDEPWHYNNGSCLRTRNFREKDKLLSQAKRLHEDALIMDSNNFQVKEALSKCDLN